MYIFIHCAHFAFIMIIIFGFLLISNINNLGNSLNAPLFFAILIDIDFTENVMRQLSGNQVHTFSSFVYSLALKYL